MEVAERFLEEELHNSGHRIDPVDRARFHRLVRLCVENWSRHPQAGLRMTRGKKGIALLFEGPMSGRGFAVFTLRVDYQKGEYRFVGPNPDRERMGLAPQALDTLDRLRDLYAALLSDTSSVETAVYVRLRGRPFPDILPLVEETRRVLDGGADGTQSGGGAARTGAGRLRRRRAEEAETRKGSSMRSESKQTKGKTASQKPRPGGLQPTCRVTAIVLTSPDPKDSAAFYRRIFGVKSGPRTAAHDHAVYEVGGVALIIRHDLTTEERRRVGLGSVSRNRGWGLFIRVVVDDFDACLKRVKRIPDALLLEDPEDRFMLVRDPAGYVLEVSST